ncbi:uncharacterized protein LOC122615204 [Drosophila teissieri]|uniref:uncharacterized protein LOC122615202 n=1 Tax=Drosophila teissieri TaxID=7243 RepID=UPI001CBA5721|nr:uncharacterized protein LOC122615202 [Drosophila teissieri]XP_043646083.1 uncharacterized protein LOC122615203 [Drosophila teissieri]XP_043646084.1 uncharacterized protein LOC122615204 [Drosophila teissieri]
MDKKDITKMLKKKLITEINRERKQNKLKDEVIQDKLEFKKHVPDLRRQLDMEKAKTKELRMKLSALEKFKLSLKLKRIAKENKCYICHLKYEVTGGHRPVSIKCGHLFGENCILAHLDCNNQCPICKSVTCTMDIRFIIAGQHLCTAELME